MKTYILTQETIFDIVDKAKRGEDISHILSCSECYINESNVNSEIRGRFLRREKNRNVNLDSYHKIHNNSN